MQTNTCIEDKRIKQCLFSVMLSKWDQDIKPKSTNWEENRWLCLFTDQQYYWKNELAVAVKLLIFLEISDVHLVQTTLLSIYWQFIPEYIKKKI